MEGKLSDAPTTTHAGITLRSSRYLLLVFLAGIGTLGVEMIASRLLAGLMLHFAQHVFASPGSGNFVGALALSRMAFTTTPRST